MFPHISFQNSNVISRIIVVSVRSSSVRSVTLWFYSRKPPGLNCFGIEAPDFTTKAQRHEDEEFGFDLDGIKINRAAGVPARGRPMPGAGAGGLGRGAGGDVHPGGALA